MSEQGFTPWKLDVDESAVYEGERLVCTLTGGSNDEWRQGLRDGRMIAAAPAMHEALEAINHGLSMGFDARESSTKTARFVTASAPPSQPQGAKHENQ